MAAVDSARKSGKRSARGFPPATSFLLPAILVLLVFVCFWPLTKFFFAQDDFILLERATHGARESIGGFFAARPGQFRPLTKGLYFLLAWPLFGFHAAPYHVASILLHVLNAFLVRVVLRRLGISTAVSNVVTVLFAFNVGYLEAIAWISCVQQLIGSIFLLLTLIYGLDALSARRPRAQLGAALAYALALASYEQTLAAPLVLVAWQWSRHGFRAALSAAWGPLRALVVLMVVYAAFMFGLKGMPENGPYAMSVGANVLANLRAYTGLAFSVWLVLPAYGLPWGFTWSHGVWIALVLVHVARGTFRDLLFGATSFLVLLAPVLFTREHTHSFHLYVPAIGAWFVLAVAVEAVRGMMKRPALRRADVVLALAAAVCIAGSVVAVRANVKATISDVLLLPRSFVLRRAVMAERMCRDIRARQETHETGRLVLVYPRPEARANWRNIESALGHGSAVRLALESPDLDVVFVPPADIPLRDELNIMIYTEMGRCYTVPEWQSQAQPAEPAAPDSARTGVPPR